MTKNQFLEKWSWQPTKNSSSFHLCKDELEEDLNELLANKTTEVYSPEGKSTSVYIPEKEDEDGEDMNPGGWFRVIDHT